MMVREDKQRSSDRTKETDTDRVEEAVSDFLDKAPMQQKTVS